MKVLSVSRGGKSKREKEKKLHVGTPLYTLLASASARTGSDSLKDRFEGFFVVLFLFLGWTGYQRGMLR